MQTVITLIFSLFPIFFQTYQTVGFEMTKRSVAKGKKTSTMAHIYFNQSGEMVTKITHPGEAYILNNNIGEVKIYDPKQNTVAESWSETYKIQNTTYYHFLVGNTENMGLDELGFILESSEIQDKLLVSRWESPPNLRKQFDYVELVSDGIKNIFMGYLRNDGSYKKKIFYYDYEYLDSSPFPMSITEIDFLEGDSLVTKLSFSNFRFDHPDDSKMINFKIPKDATLLK